jgi:hypothetical protein
VTGLPAQQTKWQPHGNRAIVLQIVIYQLIHQSMSNNLLTVLEARSARVVWY